MKFVKIALLTAVLAASITAPTVSFAKQCGCTEEKGNNGLGNGCDGQPPGAPKPNDTSSCPA